jgi:peptidoglycan/LPS O-acetylase OafA/YrhL
MRSADSRFVFFDGLRGLAALNVALSHFLVAFDFAIYTGRVENSHGSWDIALSAYPFLFVGAGANFSVTIFLALSGFVLANSFHNSRLALPGLVVRRAIRLGVPVLAASLLGWALLENGLIFNQRIAAITKSDWLAMQFIQSDPSFADGLYQAWNSLLGNATLANSYNSVLWTMPIEFVGSMVLILVFCTGISRISRTGAGILLLLLGVVIGRTFVSIMLFGGSAYLLQAHRFASRLKWRFAILLLICFLGTVPFSVARGPYWDAMVSVMGFVPSIDWHVPGFINQGNVSLWHEISAVALVVLLSGWEAAQKALSGRVFKYLGKISFPLYLTHIPALFSAGCFGFMIANAAGATYPVAVAVAFIAYAPTAFIFALAMEWLVDIRAITLAAAVSGRMATRGRVADAVGAPGSFIAPTTSQHRLDGPQRRGSAPTC